MNWGVGKRGKLRGFYLDQRIGEGWKLRGIGSSWNTRGGAGDVLGYRERTDGSRFSLGDSGLGGTDLKLAGR